MVTSADRPLTPEGVLWLDECTSTNIEAVARIATPGLRAVAAQRQTTGRGRQGRRWYSEASLCLSWIARPACALTHGSLLPLMVAVVLAEYCETLGVTATVKWPNDLLVDGRKLAGILCEARTDVGGWTAVVGVGLNLQTPPDGWPADVPGIALDALLDAPPERRQLADGLVHRLDRALPALASVSGRRRIIRDWMDFALPIGTPMQRDTCIGTFAGLAPDGALQLQTDAGLTTVHAGDVDLTSLPGKADSPIISNKYRG